MRRCLENWRLLFRSLAVPTLLIASPVVLAKYWSAWRHFLGPVEALTQCGLVVIPLLVTEAIVALGLAVMLSVLSRRGTIGPTASEGCSEVLTLLVLGYAGFRFLAGFNNLGPFIPLMLSGACTEGFILMRLRSDRYPRLRLDQFNRSSDSVHDHRNGDPARFRCGAALPGYV
jgi:hypothetical protein